MIKNTLVLSALNLGVAFWIPIGFALLINELRLVKFKKFAQTASYLPYFISSVVVAGMALSFLSSDGIINKLIVLLGGEPFLLNMKPQYFPMVYTLINIWRNFGWGSILYLSSMASIDTALYEAASLDGANRWHKMWHITLPSIKPTIVVMLIMGVGGMLNADSDMILLLYSPATYEYADVIGTYLYRYGLVGGNFSYGTAVGLFISLINFGLMFLANKVSRRVADYSLW
ncbi:MAG: ABC transporter permease subunit [Ruthenibacterium lactatiformans]|uniref:ABC transporter permease subunit n=1 Tax=Ruthenibacterium lactatiformans TaxID=1550024 RepID=UPI00266C8F63|nr:ABC transporter permease subunit [Ruthenibacterium lactatiformans]